MDSNIYSKVDLLPQYGQLGGCCELMAALAVLF
jgi:hypothetical protein